MLNNVYNNGNHTHDGHRNHGGKPLRVLQSLNRGLQALDYLKAKMAPARLTDIASALGVEKSNDSHVVKTLVAAGYATQDDQRRYLLTNRAGAGASDIAREHTLEEIIACKECWCPALEALVRQTGECAHLAVLVDQRVWYIDKIDSTLPLKVAHPIGSLSPLHCTALGKAFLAFGDARKTGDLTGYTPKTITSVEALEREIERTRQLGYAVDDEEFAPGIRCVARAIMDKSDRMIAALGLSGPSVRIDDERLAEMGFMVSALSETSPAKELS